MQICVPYGLDIVTMDCVEEHHRKLNRWRGWDYSENGWYFVTICTRERKDLFGGIENNLIKINDCGMVVKKCWDEIPNHFEGVGLDEFIILPNHVHGIVILNGCAGMGDGRKFGIVGNADLRSLRRENNLRWLKMADYDRTKMYLPKIIQGFKSSVSRKIGRPIWQKSFYDRIIRDEKECDKIRFYIRNNPKLWYRDRNNHSR